MLYNIYLSAHRVSFIRYHHTKFNLISEMQFKKETSMSYGYGYTQEIGKLHFK